MIEKMSNTTIQVSQLTKNKLKELKYDLRVETYEEVIQILLESRKKTEKQVIYTRKKIRNICDKDESLYTYFEDVDDMLANCLNIIDDDYYELEKGDE